MAVFSYRAAKRDGAVTEGLIEAADEEAAVVRLKSAGAIPLKVHVENKGLRERMSLGSSKVDLPSFTAELYVLMNAGLPLDRGLHILAEAFENKGTHDVVLSLLKAVREGKTFSDALRMHPRIFPEFYINMIKAGESGGALDVVLDKLNEFLESSRQLKEHVFSALIYPAILVATCMISIIVLFVFVVPKLSTLLSDMGGSLPASTRMLFSLSSGLRSYWWVAPVAIGAGIVWFQSYIKSEKGRCKWDALKLRLMGDIVTKLETARFCRTLGTLLKGGVPLLQALGNAKDVIGNRAMASALQSISGAAKEGRGITDTLADARIFPPFALSMIRVGEETGRLEDMLLKVASAYERSLAQSIKRFVSLFEPVIILSLGLIIGFIVVSILAAIFSITDLPF